MVFEVLSPGNTTTEMMHKHDFYQRYGVEEYYIYDPDHNDLVGWRRVGPTLELILDIDGWVSPRLGVRFDVRGPELHVTNPDGTPFLTFEELAEARTAAEARASDAEARASDAEARATRMAERLRALGIDPDAVA